MSDKTETQALVDMLGVFASRANEIGKYGIAEAIAKASLQLHDQAEEIERLKAALLECARQADALKKPCGMDPESAQAVRNAQYANISTTAHVALGTIRGVTDSDEHVERLKAEIAAMRSEVDAIANNLGEISGMIGNQFVVDTICQEIDRLFAITADAASPGEAPRAKSPTYDALLIIAQSVVGALHRAGLDDCDDPGEAIDVVRRSAYDDGWRTAANWMDRAELHDDIGSPAYIADRDVALGRSLLSVR